MSINLMKKVSIGIIASSLIISCAQESKPNKTATGTLLGAGAGALLGSTIGKGSGQLVGVAIGTMAGAYIGNQIGAGMDKADQAYHNQTTQQSLENSYNGNTLAWKNPQNGHEGFITPVKTFKDAQNNRYCREYRQKVLIGDDIQETHGTACRNPDGTWEIMQ